MAFFVIAMRTSHVTTMGGEAESSAPQTPILANTNDAAVVSN
jgi:hypothetical protein